MLRKILAFFIVLMILMSAQVLCYDYRGEDEDLKTYIWSQCIGYDIPPELIYSVIMQESSWNADAVNSAGNCIGLMQISTINLENLGETLGVYDLYDPYQNVTAGISMLADYIERYGDYHMALMCYNCGEGGASNLFEQGVYSTSYSRSVMDRMAEYEGDQSSYTEDIFRYDPPISEGTDEEEPKFQKKADFDEIQEINPVAAVRLAVSFQENSPASYLIYRK